MQSKNAIRFALFGLGFLSIGTQVYLMREFLTVFQGNELILGVVLAIWMFLTGSGAYMARFFHRRGSSTGTILLLLVVVSLLPVFMLISLDLLKSWLIPYGSMVGLWDVVRIAGTIQFPFCLVNGFLFSVLSTLFYHSEDTRATFDEIQNKNRLNSGVKGYLASAYSMESFGSLVSGALINFLFLWIFNTWQGLAILTSGFIFPVLFFAFIMTNRVRFFLLLLFYLVFTGFLFGFDFQEFSERIRYPGQHIMVSQGTPFGEVVITENANQFNFYGSGMLMFSTGNEISIEEKVHFPMVQHPLPRHVLLVSGGFSGTLSELLKYHPIRIDYVEMNPSMIRIAHQFTRQLNDTAIHTFNMDPRRFILKTEMKYDVAIIDLPEPSTLQVNRFYTHEFFSLLKQRLNPGAVVSLSLPTSGDYVSQQAGQLNSSIYNTLKRSFAHVLPVAVDRIFFLGSDSALQVGIPERIMEKGIETVFVNPYYLDSSLLQDRSDNIIRNLSDQVPINRDFKPIAMIYQHVWWMPVFPVKPWALILLSLVVAAMVILTLNPVNAGLFTGGFTLASTEVLLILALQILYGYVFQMIGVIFMLFMLGLAIGAKFSSIFFRSNPLRYYLLLQIILAAYAMIVPFLIFWLHMAQVTGILVQLLLAFLALDIAGLVGMEYGLAVRLSKTTPSSAVAINYSADLFGSAIGAFLVTLFLFPMLGLIWTGMILSLLNLFSAICLFYRRSGYL